MATAATRSVFALPSSSLGTAGQVCVGEVDAAGLALVAAARAALQAGLDQCGPGRPYSGVGAAVQRTVQAAGLAVIPAFTGHGIGRHNAVRSEVWNLRVSGSYFHGPPDIFPCRNSYPGLMQPGQVTS